MYWGPDYKFDFGKLHVAHQWCQSETKRYLQEGDSVIVSNTFTMLRELKPYFEIAKEFNIVPQVIVCQNEFGNVHNVPEETMKRMKERFAFDISELFT